jgi:hypothetical protein
MDNASNKNNAFRIGCWEHFWGSVLPDWIRNRKSYDGFIATAIITNEFIEPLSSFVQKAHEKFPNSQLVQAGNALINYLNFDLASKFRNDETVVLEQIDKLKSLVYEFLAIYTTDAYPKVTSTSAAKTKAAKAPRIKNPPTKDELLEYKEKWIFDTGIERGWIKDAINKSGISRSMFQKIRKS